MAVSGSGDGDCDGGSNWEYMAVCDCERACEGENCCDLRGECVMGAWNMLASSCESCSMDGVVTVSVACETSV